MGDEKKPEEGKEPEAEVTGIGILDDEDFAPEEDFGEPIPQDDEDKKDPEDDPSKSTDDTPDDAAGGEGSGKKEGDESEESGKDEGDGKDKKPDTIPYNRFAEVVKDRNELREKIGEVSGRLSTIEKDRVADVAKSKEEAEENDEELDEPFQGSNREFRDAVRVEAEKASTSKGAELEKEITRLTLRVSEREARDTYSDYDKIVNESGVMGELMKMADAGDAEARSTIRDILASKNPASKLYTFAREAQGLTPPRVDEIDPDKWDDVEPTLKKLGLNTTKEAWEARRSKEKDDGGEKKKKDSGKKSGAGGTLRDAPGGAGPDDKNDDDGDYDLDKLFPM